MVLGFNYFGCTLMNTEQKNDIKPRKVEKVQVKEIIGNLKYFGFHPNINAKPLKDSQWTSDMINFPFLKRPICLPYTEWIDKNNNKF